MSEQTGPEDLGDYLLGKSPLSRAYATLGKPMPAAALDEAIMKQAGRALLEGQAPNNEAPRWQRWMVPASVAAVVLVSFSLVLRIVVAPFDPEARTPMRTEQDHSKLLERPGPSVSRPRPISIDTQGKPASPRLSTPAATIPAEVKHVEAPASGSLSGPDQRVTPSLQQSADQLRHTLDKLQTIKANIPEQSPGEKVDGVSRDPDRWLEEIEALVVNGELDKARIEFELFRGTHPDYPVDAELLKLSH